MLESSGVDLAGVVITGGSPAESDYSYYNAPVAAPAARFQRRRA